MSGHLQGTLVLVCPPRVLSHLTILAGVDLLSEFLRRVLGSTITCSQTLTLRHRRGIGAQVSGGAVAAFTCRGVRTILSMNDMARISRKYDLSGALSIFILSNSIDASVQSPGFVS